MDRLRRLRDLERKHSTDSVEHQKSGEALRDRHLIERRLFQKASGALRERHPIEYMDHLRRLEDP